MLFGSRKKTGNDGQIGQGANLQPAQNPAPMMGLSAGQNVIFDACVADFEEKVIKASLEKPVIVDFWAPWCGPCKQLMPVLEQAVNGAGGQVLMAKVNLDENQELAAAMRVQSVPTVYAFFQGQPVNGFQGAKSAAEIQSFIQQLITLANNAQPEALDIDAALKQAATLLSEKRPDQAQQLYAAILQQDATNAKAFAGIVRTFIALDQVDQAAQFLDNAPDEIRKTSAFQEAQTAVELAKDKPATAVDKLVRQVEENPDDLEALYDLACAEFSQNAHERAFDCLMQILRKDRSWNDGRAKEQLLKFFEALGPADPLVITARRKLSTLLFS